MVEADVDAFPALWERSKLWSDPRIQDRVLVSWVRCLLDQRLLEEGLKVSERHDGAWTNVQRALILNELGRTAEAEAALGDAPPKHRHMEERLYWHAARYRLTLDPEDLTPLLSMTLAGASILPGLVPLDDLPRDRPDLAAPYPLDEVLATGWKEAIERRLDEVPALELKLLGRFKLNHLGRDITLTGRHQELLTLMTLGVSKEAIGEAIWPETPARKVKNSLYVHQNALRKILEPWGVGTYLDDVTLIRTRTDLWELELALEADDARTVHALYQGPLTPEIDVDLVAEARDSLHTRVVDVLLSAGLAETTWRAESYLRRVLELDPLNEDALQELLRRLLKRGRRSEAVRTYKIFSSRLKNELDIEPDRDTKAILGL